MSQHTVETFCPFDVTIAEAIITCHKIIIMFPIQTASSPALWNVRDVLRN
jgi:hypothetical protein